MLSILCAWALLLSPQARAAGFDSVTAIVVTRQLQTRLIGTALPPADPVTKNMVGLLKADSSDSALAQAAKLAAAHANFPRRILRDYFAMMQNLDGTHQEVNFSKAVAFAVKKAIDGDIRPIFYGNETCLLKDAEGNIVNPENFDLAANAGLDLRTALVCTPGQKAYSSKTSEGVEIFIPETETMGMFTLGGNGSFADTVFTMGTNLRFGLVLLRATFGEEYGLPNLRSNTYSDRYVGPFIDRNPAGRGLSEYQNNCVSCHGLHGSFAPCRHWDYNHGGSKDVIYVTNPDDTKSKCNGSDPRLHRNIYPGGFVRSDNGWYLSFTPSVSKVLGFTGPRSGYGLNALGRAWASIPRVYVNFIERILWDRNGVCVGVSVDDVTIRARASELQSDGDLVRQFIKAAASRNCLGIK